MNSLYTKMLESLSSLFSNIDSSLEEYDWENNKTLQFPTLLASLAVKMNWDEQEIRRNDPLVRFYIREHNDWHVTRGAHGGIMRMSDKAKKEQSKSAKNAAKEAARAAVEAKEAPAATTDTAE